MFRSPAQRRAIFAALRAHGLLASALHHVSGVKNATPSVAHMPTPRVERAKAIRSAIQKSSLHSDIMAAKTPAEFMALIGQDSDVQASQRRLATERTTKSQHIDARGNYTSAREKLHDRIVESVAIPGTRAKSGETPNAVFFIGPPGSGKTTILRPLVKDIDKHAVVDIDSLRKHLPEYDSSVAGLSQDEMSDVETRIHERLVRDRHHVVFDFTGKSPDKLVKLAKMLKAAGYNVQMLESQLPALTAAKRAYERFKTGKDRRYVDSGYIINSVDGNPHKTYKTLKESGYVDSWESYDSDVPKGTSAKKVDSGSRPQRRTEGK